MKLRVLFFCSLLILSALVPFPLFLFVAFLYVFVYPGYELLLIALFVDAFFGTTPTSIDYTIGVGAMIACGVLIKPQVSWYKTHMS